MYRRHLSLALCGAVIAGCAAEPSGGTLVGEGARLRDGLGREVVLRGINARVEGLFDVTFQDGRVPLEEVPPFGREDLRMLRDDLGMNALRLPINWSGLQPEGPGPLNDDYLSRLDDMLAMCAEEEVWCLVDVHQNAWSKEIGEDGAPLWAIVPPPDELLEGPLDDLEARRTSAQVLRAFATFFADQAGLQDAYLDMLEQLAAHLAARPYVAGIEVFNEPVGDNLEIMQFAQAAVEAVHRGDVERLAIFQPNALRNLQDRAETFGGLALPNTAYAPHLYPEVFSGDKASWQNGDATRLVESTERAKAEAEEHVAPLVVTEYGIDPDAANGLAWIATMDDEMDRARASRFFWLYEERSQDRWGLWRQDGRLRDALADVLARPYPSAVTGELVGFALDGDELRVRVTGGGEHRLRVPKRWAPSWTVTCDGVTVTSELDGSDVVVSCGGGGAAIHELALTR